MKSKDKKADKKPSKIQPKRDMKKVAEIKELPATADPEQRLVRIQRKAALEGKTIPQSLEEAAAAKAPAVKAEKQPKPPKEPKAKLEKQPKVIKEAPVALVFDQDLKIDARTLSTLEEFAESRELTISDAAARLIATGKSRLQALGKYGSAKADERKAAIARGDIVVKPRATGPRKPVVEGAGTEDAPFEVKRPVRAKKAQETASTEPVMSDANVAHHEALPGELGDPESDREEATDSDYPKVGADGDDEDADSDQEAAE